MIAEDKKNQLETTLPKASERPKPELPVAPEIEEVWGEAPVKKEEVRPAAPETIQPAPPISAPAKPAPLPSKDPVLTQVEHILEENLQDVYSNLPPEVQKKFHDKGDEVAGKIRVMLTEAKIKAKKVLNLIRSWLKLIPGINKFFLEQEAKIKTDKMMMLAKYEKEKR